MTDQEMISAAAASMGRKGGSVKSEAKAAAVRKNGLLGGRPRKRVNARTTLDEIRQMLLDDGFPELSERAAEIKKASMSGSLLWTADKIVTTDKSRICVRR